MVVKMASLGTSQEDIAFVIGISPKTLRKYFRKELNESAINANLQVAETLFKMATSGNHIAATIFWAKTRNGFKVPTPIPPPTIIKAALPSPPPTILVVNNDGAPIATD